MEGRLPKVGRMEGRTCTYDGPLQPRRSIVCRKDNPKIFDIKVIMVCHLCAHVVAQHFA